LGIGLDAAGVKNGNLVVFGGNLFGDNSLAKALMSPVLVSMTQRNSRAGPTAFLAAESSASSTAPTRTSRLIPFSRSQNSKLPKNRRS
jgi:hypothetical protein